ncbi:MAG: nucleotide exchange factor GrpE [bacterium]
MHTCDHQKELSDVRAELGKVKEELEKITARSEEHLDGWKRAKADYLNLKKESEKAQTEIAGYATGMFLFELLPIVDNFERAIDHLTDQQKKEEWVKGMLGIHQQLQQLLKDFNLERIPTDVPFNPEIHEAVSREFRDNVAEGTILKVVVPGYRMNGKLLRPAQVTVAADTEKAGEAGSSAAGSSDTSKAKKES